jgi:tetratricopeptide (TPR) repeat protein
VKRVAGKRLAEKPNSPRQKSLRLENGGSETCPITAQWGGSPAGPRLRPAFLALAGALICLSAFGQTQNRQRIDVQNYAGEIRIDPKAQTLAATVTVHFLAVDDVSAVAFELNNTLSLDKVTDEQGRQIQASRLKDDMSVRLTLPQPIAKGQAGALTFVYDGKLTGDEESPVFGIKFAAIHPDFAYLLYPARWFPINDYTVDRFSADWKITVPAGYKALGSGVDSSEPGSDGMTSTRWKFSQPSFPGSIAVVRSDSPNTITSAGVATTFCFRESASMAGAYGDEFGRAMGFFTDLYGAPPKVNMTVVETETGAPNGYSAPGLVFLAPKSIGKDVNLKIVANQVARQWWEEKMSPTTRNHLWIENGMARYSELLYLESVNGPGALETERHDVFVTALTVDNPPLIQSARLEDYSPEYWAATAGKGAAVVQMLRDVLGEANFKKLLLTVPQQFAWKSLNTDDFHAVAQDIYGQSLNYFFQQWIESSGAPQFTLKYTVSRVKNAVVSPGGDPQPGFRVMGTISQDLDLFSMPVTLHIETEGNPEERQIQVVGTSSDFSVDTYGKPRNGAEGVTLDPKDKVLKFNDTTRVEVAIRKGEQHAEVNEFPEALKEYQKALDVVRNSSLAHYRIGEIFFLQGNWTSASNAFHDALTGDGSPMWTQVWSHIHLGWIYDISDQRPRALSEYNQALRTKDNSFSAQEEAQKGVDHPYQRPRTASN